MLLNSRQLEALKLAALPLSEFLMDNAHPHATVLVAQNSVELVEGIGRAIIPVVVPRDANADEMNKKYGESYGVDWTYPNKTEGNPPAAC